MRSLPIFALAGLVAAACQSPKGADSADGGRGGEALRPVAVAGRDLALTLTPDDLGELKGRIAGDGSRSFMPGRPGADLTYRWHVSMTSGAADIDDDSSPTPTFSLTGEGVHVFTLVVIHQGVEALPDRVSITAERGQRRNTPPVADFTVAPERPIVGLEIVLDAAPSHDEDSGDVIAEHLWEVEPPAPGGELLALGTESVARFTPDREGEYLVRLVVTDNRGARTRLERGVFVAACEPVGEEICNGEDEDCDGSVDEGLSTDADGDGHYAPGSCRRPADDCDDDDGLRFPGGVEICDNRDNDCDDEADEGLDADGDGVTPCAGDCDDDDSGRFPGAEEVCDRVDQDCDGEVDEGFDSDGDGYTRCAEPVPDCDDSQESINPTAVERCDGIDNNCDGMEGFDVDGDGFSTCQEDCDDDENRNPGVPEIPGNGIDEDCDGSDAEAACRDQDADGYCAFGISCDRAAAGCNEEEWDCNDSVATARPGQAEVCDLRDNDCDGGIDEGFDVDGDNVKTCQGDCDDNRADVCPFCPELCDGVDNNCNFLSDEGLQDCEAPCEGPGVESCNGADDDCDGEIDEEVGHGDPCVRPLCPGGTPGTWHCGEVTPGAGDHELRCIPALIIQTERDVTCLEFSRPTAATYIADAAGTIAHAAADEPRFEHDAVTGEAHLLIEGERTNLVYDTATPSAPDWDVSARDTQLAQVDEGAPDGGPFTSVQAGEQYAGPRLVQEPMESADSGDHLSHSVWLKGVADARVLWSNPNFTAWFLTEGWRRYEAGATWAHAANRFVFSVNRWDGAGAGVPLATEFDIWGAQTEIGPFSSSYIPRAQAADVGRRAADSLTIAAAHVEPATGAYLTWIRPVFSSATAGAVVPLLDAGAAVRLTFDGQADATAFVCAAGDRTARLPAEFPASAWMFIGCSWDSANGVRLVHHRQAPAVVIEAPGAFAPGARPAAPVVVAPLWSRVGEIRLGGMALSAEALQAHIAATEAAYR